MTKTLTQVSIAFIRFLMFTAVVAMLGHHAHAQQNTITGYNQVVGQMDMANAARTNVNRQGAGSPNGRDACVRVGDSYFQTDASAGANLWYCTALPSTWKNQSSGSGTVTSFSAGALSPLFVTSVATATTTPALSFSLSSFSADNIFGNFTGSSAPPSTQTIPPCANDGSHALVYPSHTLTCEAIPTFTWPSAGIMVSTGSAAGASLTTTSGLQGITFTTGVPSLTALGTAATSTSTAFQAAITGVANEVFGGTGPGMIALTSSYLPLSSMGTITGGTWNGSAIARAYGGLNSTTAGTGILRDGATPSASEISGACSTSGSNFLTCLPAGGGIPGGVAAIASTVTSSGTTTPALIVGYQVPASTIQSGTTYRIRTWGVCTASGAQTSTLSVNWGTNESSSDQALLAGSLTSASGTTVAFTSEFYITFQSTTAAEAQGVTQQNGTAGISNAAIKLTGPTNTTGLTTTSSEYYLSLNYVGNTGLTTVNFYMATIELVKP